MPESSGQLTHTRRVDISHKGIAAQRVTILFNRGAATQRAKPTRAAEGAVFARRNAFCNQHKSRDYVNRAREPSPHLATALVAVSVRRTHGERVLSARPDRLANTTPLTFPAPVWSHPVYLQSGFITDAITPPHAERPALAVGRGLGRSRASPSAALLAASRRASGPSPP